MKGWSAAFNNHFCLLLFIIVFGMMSAVQPIFAQTADTVVLSTRFGNIVIQLLPDVAPKTVANFEKLVKSHFYDGTIFHRIVPGFVIQGGDPNTISGPRNTWNLGDAGYRIPPEFNDMNFAKYAVGMARSSDVNSGSSQFFITVGDASFLNGKYTLFGQVVSGQDVVDKIASLPTNSASQPLDADAARINNATMNFHETNNNTIQINSSDTGATNDKPVLPQKNPGIAGQDAKTNGTIIIIPIMAVIAILVLIIVSRRKKISLKE